MFSSSHPKHAVISTPKRLYKIEEKRLSKPAPLEGRKMLSKKRATEDVKGREDDEFLLQAKRLSKEFDYMRKNRTPSKIRGLPKHVSTEKHSLASERSEEEFQ